MQELMYSTIATGEESRSCDYLIQFEQIAKARDLMQLGHEIRKVSSHLGFAHFIYGARVKLANGEILQYIFNGYPEAWMAAYQSANYVEIDPIVEHCFFQNSCVPLVWSEQTYNTKQRLSFMEEAQSHGIGSGISVPIRGANGDVALFSVANPNSFHQSQHHHINTVGAVYVLGAHVHEAINRLVYSVNQPNLNKPGLTIRELECLKWWVGGKSGWDISQILNLSERTVRFHLENVKRKFGVSSKAQAVAKAIHFKIISL